MKQKTKNRDNTPQVIDAEKHVVSTPLAECLTDPLTQMKTNAITT